MSAGAPVVWHRPEYEHRLDELVDQSTCAALAKVTRAAVSNWIKRHPGFPKPVASIGKGARGPAQRLFVQAEFESWLSDHRHGHSTNRSRVQVLADEIAFLDRLAARHTRHIEELKTRLLTASSDLRGTLADRAVYQDLLDREIADAHAHARSDWPARTTIAAGRNVPASTITGEESPWPAVPTTTSSSSPATCTSPSPSCAGPCTPASCRPPTR
ncbi:hypothetical protein ACIQF6_28420 [Kitasatospora sp. NPDC092948]|uniref:hypothetical protein n=1 Tax=Kitasatospora sp. NPDC092948 TaxID=3364088 RepID=UPI00380EEE47